MDVRYFQPSGFYFECVQSAFWSFDVARDTGLSKMMLVSLVQCKNFCVSNTLREVAASFVRGVYQKRFGNKHRFEKPMLSILIPLAGSSPHQPI